MTLRKRVIVCLDVADGSVVKGVRFAGLRAMGDPVALASGYEAAGADEIVFLDVSAALDGRETLLDCVRHTADVLFIPLTVGGGIRSVEDASRALRAGADKIAVNTAAVERPALLTELSAHFGAQCVVASIDARRTRDQWEVFVRGATTPTGRDAITWARECVERGAGEILLTSIDRDGTRAGYDLALTQAVAARVSVPVVASGGAGSAQDVRRVLTETGADAALVAGILHEGGTTVDAIKLELANGNVSVRAAV